MSSAKPRPKSPTEIAANDDRPVRAPVVFNVPLSDLLSAVYRQVDGQRHAVFGETEFPFKSPKALSQACAVGAETGHHGYLHLVAGDDVVGIRLAFLDPAMADEVAGKLSPSLRLSGPEGQTHLVYLLSSCAPQELQDLIDDLNEDAPEGFSASDKMPLPYSPYELSADDVATLESGDDFMVYTLKEFEDALFEVPTDAPVKEWEWNDAVVYGDIPDEVRNLPMKISIGSSQEEKKWKSVEATFGQWMEHYLTKHTVGKKNGSCFVTGDVIDGKRSKNSMRGMYALGIDVDSGASMDDAFKVVQSLGVFAVFYTTHSHLSTEITIKQNPFYQWCENSEIDTDPTTESIRAYLRKEGKYDASVIDSAEFEETVHDSTGIHHVVRTKPIEKFRVIFPLAEPYVFAKQNMSQKDSILTWERMVAGMGAALGVQIDRSARDPSRLFFYPRHAKGGKHRTLINAGNLIEWEKITQADPKAKVSNDPFERAADILGGRLKGRPMSPTKGLDLMTWAGERANGFEISEVFKDYCDERLRGEISNGKFACECPFDENHSNSGDHDDVGCYIQDASVGESFVWHCQHDSCADKDRLSLLEKAMQDDWFDDDVLTDPKYDCIDRGEQPEPRGDKAGGEERARELYEEYLAHDKPDANRTTALCAAIACLGDDGESLVDEFKLGLSKAKLVTTYGFNKALKAERDNVRKVLERGGTVVEDEVYDPERAAKQAKAKFASLKKLKKPLFMLNRVHEVASLRHLLTELDRANRGDEVGGFEPKHELFDFGNNRVRISRDPYGKRRIYELSREVMKNISNELLYVCDLQDSTPAEVFLPDDLAYQAIVDPGLHLLPLKRFVRHPLFDKDGNLLLTTGYHPETQCYIDLKGLDLSGIDLDEEVAKNDVDEAVAGLDFIFSDFRWTGYGEDDSDNGAAGSRAAYYALLIAPLIREAFDGNQMLFGIDKPDISAGGTMLARCANIIWTGENPALKNWPGGRGGEEEVGKLIISLLMEGRGAIMFDNVHGVIAGSFIPMLATGNVGGRILGGNKTLEGEMRDPVVFIGNDLNWSDENARRILPIRINPTDPEDKDNFNVSDLPVYLKENRAEVLTHLITIVRWWFQQGCPETEKKVDSFEKFTTVMGGILDAAGIDGWLDGREAFLQDAKKDQSDEVAILEALLEHFGLEKEFTRDQAIPELFEELEGGSGAFTRYDAKYDYLRTCVQNGAVSPGSLGKKLGYLKRKEREITHKGERIKVRLAYRRSDGGAYFKVVKVVKEARH